MTSEEYRKGVLRTESGRFDSDHIDDRFIRTVFGTFIAAAKAMDAVKRGLYYGKEVNWDKLYAAMNEASSSIAHFHASTCSRRGVSIDEDGVEHLSGELPGYSETPSVNAKLVHAAIGLATESGEIIEKILDSFESSTPFDYKNLFEELGDIAWYEALAIDTAGQTDPDRTYCDHNGDCEIGPDWSHEGIWQKNLNKLKARYPDKFSTEKAFDRDLEKEKKALGQ